MNRFEQMYEGTPPWEIGRAQPAIVRLVDSGRVRGRVLDVGCGTGENAMYAASRGLAVLGVDSALRAVERARAKAVLRGVEPRFAVQDALSLDELQETFDSVIDSGLFHMLSDGQRAAYVRSLATVLKPASMVYLLCFSDEEPGSEGPRRVTVEELVETFRMPFAVERLERTRFANRLSSRGAVAWLASICYIGRPISSNV